MSNSNSKGEKNSPEICITVSYGDIETERINLSSELKVHEINQWFSKRIHAKGKKFYLIYPPEKNLKELGIKDGDNICFIGKTINGHKEYKQKNENSINEEGQKGLINWFIDHSHPIQTFIYIIIVVFLAYEATSLYSQGKVIQEQGSSLKKMVGVLKPSIKVLQLISSKFERSTRPLDLSIVDDNDKIKILNTGDSLISIKNVYMKNKDNLRIHFKYNKL